MCFHPALTGEPNPILKCVELAPFSFLWPQPCWIFVRALGKRVNWQGGARQPWNSLILSVCRQHVSLPFLHLVRFTGLCDGDFAYPSKDNELQALLFLGLVAKSCPTLATPWRSLPGSSVHGILQARMLEWVAVSFSRGSFPPRNRTWVSCIAGRFFRD